MMYIAIGYHTMNSDTTALRCMLHDSHDTENSPSRMRQYLIERACRAVVVVSVVDATESVPARWYSMEKTR